MTQIGWEIDTSGTWSTAADWVGGVPNSITADATITAPGTYTVTLSSATSDSADSVTLNNSAVNFDLLGTLALGGTLATFTFDGNDFILGSAGEISGGTLNIDTGTLVNLGGTLATTDFILGGPATIALGGKALTLGGSSLLQGFITGNNAAGNSLIVTGNAVLSDDVLFENKVTLVDAGTITQASVVQLGSPSTDVISIVINAGATYNIASTQGLGSTQAFDIEGGTATISNAGLFEATAIGQFTDSPVFKNTGTLLAAAGSDLQLYNGGSIGGTLAGAGEIDLAAGVFTFAPTLAVNVATLGVFNAVNLTGTILVGGGADIQLDNGGTIGGTLVGAGEIDLDGGMFILASTLSDSVARLGVFSTAALNGSLSDAGGITVGNAGTLELKAHTLSAGGTSLLEGTIAGTGAAGSELVISGTATLGVPGLVEDPAPEIYNDATLLVTGFAIQDNDSVLLGGTTTDKSTVAIASTGTYDLLADDINYNGEGSQIYNGGAGTVINAGLFESTGALTLGSFNYVGAAFFNTGTVLAAASTDLQFADGGSFSGTLAGPGEIDFTGGVFTLSALAINVATLGILESVALSGNLSGTGGVYIAQGEILALKAHTLSLSGTSELQGTIAGNGTAGSELIISGTAEIGVPGNAYSSVPEIYNTATLLITGVAIQDNDAEQLGSSATDKSTIAIASTGTYSLVADDINYNGQGSQIVSGGAATILNAGLFEATGTLAPGYFDSVDVAFSNTGTVLSAAGNDLQFQDGGSFNGTLAGAGEIDLGAGVYTLSPTLAINVATFGVLNSVALSGNMSGTGGVFVAQGATLALKAHTLSLSGTSDLQGTIAGNGTAGSELVISGTAYLGIPDVTANEPEIYNDATLLVTGLAIQDNSAEGLGFSSTDKSTIAIASTGTYDLIADDINYDGAGSQLYTGGAGTVINAGLFESTGTLAPGGYYDAVDVAFSSTGTVLSAAGNDLQFQDGGSFGGTLAGAGEIDLGGGVFTLSPTLAINVATFGILGSESLSSNLSGTGGLYVANGATFGLKGHTLSLAGTSSLQGTLTGNGTVGSELIIGGTVNIGIPGNYYYTSEINNDATLLVTGVAIQDNDTEQLGLNSIDKSTMAIAATGTYDLVADDTNYNGVGSQIYNGGAGTILNAGLFEATGTPASGSTDYVGVAFFNTGTVLAAAGNDLQLVNGGSLGGTLTGAGEIDLAGGLFTLSPTLAISVATLGVFGTVNLGNSLSYGGDLFINDSGTLHLNAHIVTLTGNSNLEGVIAGNGTAGSEVIIAGTAGLGVPGNVYSTVPEIYNDATLLVTGTAIQDNDSEQLGLSSIDKSTIAIAATGTYDLVSDDINYNGVGSQIYNGGAGTIFNAGLFEATGTPASGNADYVGVSFYNTGTILAAAGNDLQLENGGSIGGTLAGAGEIDLAGGFFTLSPTLAINISTLGIDGLGTASLGGSLSQTTELFIDGGTLALNNHNITQTSAIFEGGGAVTGPGTITIAGSLALNPISNVFYLADGATLLDLGSIDQTNGQLYLGDGDGAGGSLVIGAKASYTLTPASGSGSSPYSSIDENGVTATVTNAGLIYSTEFGAGYYSNQANFIDAVLNSTGTISSAAQSDLQLDAGGSISGTLAGAGEIDLAGGFFTLSPTLAINVATLGLYGTAELTGNLTDTGLFVLSAGELEFNSHILTLSGISDLEGSGTLAQAGTLKITGSDTLNAFDVSGGAVLEDASTIIQTGNLQLGLAAGDAATLQIDAGAVYNDESQLGIDYNIYSGGNGSIVNAGLLEFTGYWNGQTNTQVQANIKNTGTILNSGNDLLLTGTLVNDGVVTLSSPGGVPNSSGWGGYIIEDGAIVADSGKTGTIVIGADTFIQIESAVAGQNIMFTSAGTAGSSLDIGALGSFAGTISGFAAGDVIDLQNLLANSFSYANNILTLSEVANGATAVVGSLALSSVTGTISLVSDEGGGTEIILNNTGTSYSNPRAGTTQSNWNGASAAWTTAADWSPSGVPGSLATAYFSTGGNYSVSYATTDAIYQLLLEDTGGRIGMSSGKLTVEDGGVAYGSIAVSGGIFDAANGYEFLGQLNQATAGTLEVDAGNLLVYGNAVLAGTIQGSNDIGSVQFYYGGYGDNVTLNAGFALNGVAAYFGNDSITLGSSFTFAAPLEFGSAGTLDLNGHTLTVSGTSLFQGQYQIEGTGTLAVTGTAQIQSLTDYGKANLVDSGTIIENGGIVFGNSSADTSSIIINAGAVYDLVDDTNSYAISDSGAGSLKNAGLLELTGYGGDVESIYLPVINTGTLLATEGALALYGGGTLSGTLGGGMIDLAGGSFVLTSLAASAATLNLDGGQIDLGSNISYAGNFVDLTGSTDIYLNTFSLTLAGPANISDGIEGPGTLKVTGTTNVAGNIAVGNGAVLEDAGTLNLNGASLQIGLGSADIGQINIDAGARLTDTTGAISYYANNYYNDTDSGGVSNSGLLLVNPGGGNGSNIDVPLTNNAAGTVAVISGALTIYNGPYYPNTGVQFTNAGLFTVGSSASLVADAYIDGLVINTGSILVASGSDVQFYGGDGGTLSGTLAGTGEIDLYGGNFTLTSLAASIATLNITGSDITLGSTLAYGGDFIDTYYLDNIALNGHNLTLSGQTNLSDTIEGAGTLKITGTASLASSSPYYQEIIGGGAALEDAGTINLNNVLYLGDGSGNNGYLNIDAGAVFNLTNSEIYDDAANAGSVTNNGLLAVNPGSGNTAYISVPLVNNATGTLAVNSGELVLSGPVTNSGLITISAGNSLTSAINGPFTNTGKFILQAGQSQIAGPVTNTGSILVAASADLQLEGGGTLGGTLAGIGEIDLTGGSFTLTSLAASIATLNITGSDITLGSTLAYAGDFIDLDSSDIIALNTHSLTLSGQANLADTITGAGTLKITGTATLSAAAPYYQEVLSGGAVLENAKTINLSGDDLQIGASYTDSGQLNIDAGAVFNVTNGEIYYDGGNPYGTDTGGVSNSGLLSVNPGTGNAAYIEVPLVNNATGTVAVTSGELYMVGPLTNSGLITISSSDTLTAYIDGPLTNSGKFILQGGGSQIVGAVSNTGSIIVNAADLQFESGGTLKGTLAGSGEIDLTGGTFALTSLAVSIATLNISGSDISLGSNLTYAGDFIDLDYTDAIALNAHNLTLAGQTSLTDAIQGTGTLKVSGTASLGSAVPYYTEVLSGGAVLEDAGTINLNGNDLQISGGYYDGGQLNIDAGAVFNVTNGEIAYYGGNAYNSETGSIANSGLLSINPGSGNQAYIGVPLTNSATGTVAVTTGLVTIEGAVANAGLFLSTISSGGGLAASIGGPLTNSGKFVLQSGIFQIAGAVTNTGTITVNTADLQFESGGKLGGTLAGTGEIDLTAGSFTLTSLSVSIATLNITGSDITLGSTLAYGGDFIDLAYYDTIALSGHNFTLSGQASLDDLIKGAGTLKIAGIATLGADAPYYQETLGGGAVLEDAGTINLNGDQLVFGANYSDSGQLNIDAGAVLNTGDGGIAYYGDNPYGTDTGGITNSGLISVNPGSNYEATIEVPLTNSATGTLAVTDGVLDLTGAVANSSNGTLSGGTWEAATTNAVVGMLDIADDPVITVDAANIILSGLESDIISGASSPTVIEASLVSITTAGTLQNLAGHTYSGAANLFNAGSIILGGGLFAPADIVNTGSIAGYGTIAAPVQNSGKIIASGGTLVVAGSITGSGTLGIGAASDLVLNTGVASGDIINFSGTSETLTLDKPSTMLGTIAGFTFGDTIDIAGTAVTATSLSGPKLLITLAGGGVVTETLAATIANGRFGISSDGNSGSDLTLYRAATATLTPTTIAFGQHHVGDVVAAGLTLVNTQINDAYSEKLDASFASVGTGLTGSGSVTQLGAGGTAAGSLTIGLATTTGGSVAGNAIITLSTDGTGVDGNGALGIGTDTIAVTGTLFNEATAALSGTTLALGAHHVGDTVVNFITLTNQAAAGAYSEALDASISGTSLAFGSFSGSGSVIRLAAGSTSSSLAVTLGTGTAGSISGAVTLGLTSDGTGIDTLGSTALGGQTVTVTGATYNYASPTLASTIINFGIVHTGATVSQALVLSDFSSNAAYTEALDAAFTGTSGSVKDAGSVHLLAAGTTNSSSLSVGLLTTGSGTVSGTATLGLTSDGTGIDGLGTTALGSQMITLTGTVDNYATAALELASGTGTLTATNATTYLLNLGMIAAGTGNLVDGLGVLNSASGLADLLSGQSTTSAVSGFTNSGFGTFSGLSAGQADTLPLITLSGTNVGTFSEFITLSSTGSNASGYAGTLAKITLDVTGVVASGTIPGVTYSLTSGADTISAGGGNDTIVAVSGQLSMGDLINGGGGTNTLVLQGGGVFDMRAPTTLSNIQIVDAQENTGSLVQTLYLDAGFSGTVNAASGTAGSSFIVYGNTDSAHITLGTGNDFIYLGSASEQVNGGGGNDMFYVSSGDIGATINGGIGANTLVASGGGSFAMGSNITSISSVIINDQGTQASMFTANSIANLAITGGDGNDVIILGAAGQSVTTGSGNTVIDATAAQAGALIINNGSATLNLTTGGTAALNSSDAFLTVSLSTATNLSLSSMSFLSAIGSSGSDTITAMATQQTLTGGAGADTLVGYTGFGDMFLDTETGLNGDTIRNFGGNDLIDISNLARANATLVYSGSTTAGTLSISQTGLGVVSTIALTGTNLSTALLHMSSDGHGGTYIG